MDLHNFTLYFGYSNPDSFPDRCENWEESAHKGDVWSCRCQFRDPYASDDRYPCIIDDESNRIATLASGSAPAYVNTYGETLKNWVLDFQLFQLERMEQVIREELVKPRTAFILPKPQFEADWDLFRNVMKKSRLRFAHNAHSQDSTLKVAQGYGLNSGLNEYHQHVPKRLKGLMSSGIYHAWKKWEAYRRDFHRMRTEDTDFMPLSFERSDIAVVFYLFLIAVPISGIAFVLEWLRYGILWSTRGYRMYFML